MPYSCAQMHPRFNRSPLPSSSSDYFCSRMLSRLARSILLRGSHVFTSGNNAASNATTNYRCTSMLPGIDGPALSADNHTTNYASPSLLSWIDGLSMPNCADDDVSSSLLPWSYGSTLSANNGCPNHDPCSTLLPWLDGSALSANYAETYHATTTAMLPRFH